MALQFRADILITLADDVETMEDSDVNELAQAISDNILCQCDDVDEVEIESFKQVVEEKKEGE